MLLYICKERRKTSHSLPNPSIFRVNFPILLYKRSYVSIFKHKRSYDCGHSPLVLEARNLQHFFVPFLRNKKRREILLSLRHTITLFHKLLFNIKPPINIVVCHIPSPSKIIACHTEDIEQILHHIR